jgi:predicted ATPase
MRKVIITGGPNSGKSSIIALLAERGHAVLAETARLVIEQKGIYPWDDQLLFGRTVHREQLRREKELTGELVFLDRSLVDPVAYAEVAGIRLPEAIYRHIRDAGYHCDVFYLDMLPTYCMDRERKDSPEQAAAVHDRLRTVYSRFGFNLVQVPLFCEAEERSKSLRVEFILGRTASSPAFA